MATFNPCLDKKIQEHLFLYQPDKQDLLKIFKFAQPILNSDLRNLDTPLVNKNIEEIKSIAQSMNLSLNSPEEIAALLRVIKNCAKTLSTEMSAYAEAQYRENPIYALLHAYELLERLPTNPSLGERHHVVSVLQKFDAIIPGISGKILDQVWKLGGEPQGDPQWAENNISADLGKRAIESQLDVLFTSLSSEQQNRIDGIVYEIAESPKGGANWGAENRTKDPKRFIKAFTLLQARASLHNSLGSQPQLAISHAPKASAEELHHLKLQIQDKSFEEIVEVLNGLDDVPEEIKWYVVDRLLEVDQHYDAYLSYLSILDQLSTAKKKDQSALLRAFELLERLPENASLEAKREIAALIQKFDEVIPGLSTLILTKVWELGGSVQNVDDWAIKNLTKELGITAIQSQLTSIVGGLSPAETDELHRLTAQIAGPSRSGETPKRLIQALTLLKTPIEEGELEIEFLTKHFENPKAYTTFLKNHRLIQTTPIVAKPLDFNALEEVWNFLDSVQKKGPKPLPAPEPQPEAPQPVEEPKPSSPVIEAQAEEKTSGKRAEIEQLVNRKQLTKAINILKTWEDAPEDLKLQIIDRLIENNKFTQAYQVLALGVSKIDYQLKIPLAEAQYHERQNADLEAHATRTFATQTLRFATRPFVSAKTDNTKVLESYERGFKTLFEFAEKLKGIQKGKPSYQEKLKVLALFDLKSKEYAEVALPAYAKLLTKEGRSLDAAKLYEKFAFAKLRLMLDSNLLPDDQRKEQIRALTKTFLEVKNYLQEAAKLNPKEAEYDFWLGVVDAHLRLVYPVKSKESEYQFQPHYHFYNAWCKNTKDPFYSALFWRTSREKFYPKQYLCSLQRNQIGVKPILGFMHNQAESEVNKILQSKGQPVVQLLFSMTQPAQMLTEKLNENRKIAYKTLKIDDSNKLYL